MWLSGLQVSAFNYYVHHLSLSILTLSSSCMHLLSTQGYTDLCCISQYKRPPWSDGYPFRCHSPASVSRPWGKSSGQPILSPQHPAACLKPLSGLATHAWHFYPVPFVFQVMESGLAIQWEIEALNMNPDPEALLMEMIHMVCCSL